MLPLNHSISNMQARFKRQSLLNLNNRNNDAVILVTGATGHVGRPLIEALLGQGEEVRALLLEKETELKNVEIVQGNVLDVDSVKRAAEGVDVIYHLAAIVDYYRAPRHLMYDVNVNGTKNLLDCSKAGRFVYLSTTSVYGKRMKENPADERTPCSPDSFYGETKEMAEKMVIGKGGIVLRSPVIYGHGFNEGFASILPRIEKGSMPIIGSGSNRIQWIHISDLIQALLLAKDKGKPGETYLVAGEERKSQEELFSLLARYLNAKPPGKRISVTLAYASAYYSMLSARVRGVKPKLLPEHISRIASDRTFDISKAKAELGFRQTVGYEEGAKEIVKEYLDGKRK
jgi:nucleoside-diphosphate-sugar epimerase